MKRSFALNTTIAALAAAAVIATPVIAQDESDSDSAGPAFGYGPKPAMVGHRHGGRFFGGGPEHIERMAERLGLNQEQREAIRTVVDEARPKFRSIRDSLSEGRTQLHDIAFSGNYDEGQARTLADAQAARMADLIVLRTEVMSRAYAILTPEQQEQLKARMEQRGSRWGRR